MFGHITSDEAAASDDDPQGNGYLHYANGVQGFVRTMPCGAADWDIEVIGTKGRLRSHQQWRTGGVLEASPVQHWRDASWSRRSISFRCQTSNENANVRCVRDLIACVETGKEPNCSGADGRHALEIAMALRESHRRGGTRVALPLADRSLHIRSRETLHGDEPAIVRRARAAAQATAAS